MRHHCIFLFFVLLTNLLYAQYEEISTEVLFQQYLLNEDEETANRIIGRQDSLYSVYCEAVLCKEVKESIALFKNFIALKPPYGISQAYLWMGIIYHQIEIYDTALRYLDTSINLNPNDYYAYYFRATTYGLMENYSAAIDDYNTCIRLQPDFDLAYRMRGNTYFDLKEYSNALADLNQNIKLNKKDDEAYIVRGIIYAEMKEYKKAIADWEISKKLRPKNTRIVDELIQNAKAEMENK